MGFMEMRFGKYLNADLVARWFTTTSGSAITDLLAYDPLAGTWTVPRQWLADGTLSADGMSFAGTGLSRWRR